ncbi:DUF2849 domain-containing protein [Roseibacterium sp. SDUM158017]|uniref:DUF2849 domain-containing protein n=1 Tax=Roseicyclus salinarum TaxID=3036773 RepID=UPI002414F511|nr:DUF2849 domain-containing protein [Roseibacterium sp. SDUM158017]MDG4650054.1 DUF2849 domain-containing protein [Roseibacterium sp. SDUM158017]
MPRPFTPKVLTGNALLEGDAVWLAANGQWTRHHHEALLIEDEATAELYLLDAEARGHEVVGPYLADASPGAKGPRPVERREAFRATGPSNHAHGKQETA